MAICDKCRKERNIQDNIATTYYYGIRCKYCDEPIFKKIKFSEPLKSEKKLVCDCGKKGVHTCNKLKFVEKE